MASKSTHGVHEVGWTPLYIASEEGDVAKVRELLEKGACVNVGHDPERYKEPLTTPLYASILNDKFEVTKLLLEKGADVNFGIRGGAQFSTPLYIAALKGNLEVVKALVEMGAPVDKGNYERRTGGLVMKDGKKNWETFEKYQSPLEKAEENGHVEVVNFLKQLSPAVATGSTTSAGDNCSEPTQAKSKDDLKTELLEPVGSDSERRVEAVPAQKTGCCTVF